MREMNGYELAKRLRELPGLHDVFSWPSPVSAKPKAEATYYGQDLTITW